MDLLGGYDSSSSTDDVDHSKAVSESVKSTIPKPNISMSHGARPPTNAKGKKMLSLASVLPPHILAALTRATDTDINGRGDGLDDSDDDSRPAVVPSSHVGPPRTRRSNEFSSFLQDLQDATPTERRSTSPSRPSHEPYTRAVVASIHSGAPSAMGEAFLATTVRRTKASATVRNIHESESNDSLVPDSVSGTAKPMSGTAHSRSICAAPTVGALTQPTVLSYEPLEPVSIPPTVPFSSVHDPALHHPKSRKEMERALRRGHIDSVLDDVTSTVSGADPNDTSQLSLPRDVNDTLPHTVRNVPTMVYNPSAGGLAVASTTARNGKNQINQLLAQAAQLERERAQQPHGSQVTQVQRANAKRKYGW